MKKYGLRSAVFTSIFLNRRNLLSKEEVKQIYLDANKSTPRVTIWKLPLRSVNDDLESFYSNIRNPDTKSQMEQVEIFMTEKLTDEEQHLVDKRNAAYAESIFRYTYDNSGSTGLMRLDEDKMKKSSDSDSLFVYSFGLRCTFSLNLTLESIVEEMTDSAFKKDLMDLDRNRSRHISIIEKLKTSRNQNNVDISGAIL